MPNSAIEVKNLSFAYDANVILENISFSIREKDFLAIIGPNGGGKTTLLKILLGLLSPTQGLVRIFGSAPNRAKRSCGYVGQNPNINLDFPISVQDVVKMGRLGHKMFFGRSSKKDQTVVQKALEAMEVRHLAQKRMGNLSMGQRQRVFIARALATEPRILILDEPTTSIDTEGQTRLYELLKKLNQRITIIIVSHDVSVVSHYVTCVACVNRNLFFHNSPEISEDILNKV
ncbi:ABC transporter ATP-binding protein, partial [PVC group bacterium]|nr:ABC transporter ATP-binding protein [PVC group bacterium]